jgi:hypothetical protein
MTIRNPYRYNKKVQATIIKRSKAKAKRLAKEKEQAIAPVRNWVQQQLGDKLAEQGLTVDEWLAEQASNE